jgi:hypothetical protein
MDTTPSTEEMVYQMFCSVMIFLNIITPMRLEQRLIGIYLVIIMQVTIRLLGGQILILGEPGDLYYDPVYAPEIVYGTADQLIIDRIRLYIGDPIDIRREYGEEALSSIHPDGKTYELDEKGWPTYITMGGKAYTSSPNPSVNGYRFLRFNEYIDDVCTTCSSYVGNCGEDVTRDVTYGVDIWYYTFRHSDRQIMEAYDSCPPPSPAYYHSC